MGPGRSIAIVLAGASLAATVAGVTAQQPQPRQPRFSVVSVKPNRDSGPLTFGMQGSRFVATNIPIRLLIQRAYSTVDRGCGTADTGAPSLLTAVEEQLGLKLEAATDLVDVLVIDRIEPPAAN